MGLRGLLPVVCVLLITSYLLTIIITNTVNADDTTNGGDAEVYRTRNLNGFSLPPLHADVWRLRNLNGFSLPPLHADVWRLRNLNGFSLAPILVMVTFKQEGLDGTASGTVVTITVGTDTIEKPYNELPYSISVDPETEINYHYNVIIDSTNAGIQFQLDSITGPNSPFTVTEDTDITGHYIINIVDKTPPVITIDSPADYGIYRTDSTIIYSFYAIDNIDPQPNVMATVTGWDNVPHPVSSGDLLPSTSGVYTLSVTATDDAGNSAVREVIFVVYDPNAGFVTGGGWIQSPIGAYKADSSLWGKASFGLVSKYQKGANVPTGNTEFIFHIADFKFKSTSYEWLVIAGMKAQYKGLGTVNGAGSYKFMLTLEDGGTDTFRIKIWDADTDVVVYDNGAQSPLAGGSIIIHK